MKYYEDPILGKGRAADISGGTGGGGGTEYIFDATQFTLSGETVSITGTVPIATSAGYATSAGTAGTANAIAGDVLTGGFRMEIISGSTISQKKWFPITPVTGNSVTMQPGEAYVVQATTAAVTINTTEIPSNQYGLESHLEIFVANTGYVVTGTNVVLAQALEPDAVNNCVVRFHDGCAIISVEDHVAGYIVTVNAASGAGSLNYGLSTASNGYISIDASLNGQTLDLGGVVTSAGEKHVVGNGYTETIVSGGIKCTSKTTFSNLGMNGVIVSSGTLTLGDVNIPNGATVSVSGGGLAIEKVTGAGSASVIDLNHTQAFSAQGAWNNCVVSGVMITGGSNSGNGGIGIIQQSKQTYVDCVFSGNTANSYGGAFRISTGSIVTFDGCTFVDNSALSYGGKSLSVAAYSVAPVIRNCKLLDTATAIALEPNKAVTFQGSNTLVGIVKGTGSPGSGTVTIASGAIVDLTGNTNATPINPGGGVIVDGGGTVINSAGASVPIAGGTYTKINNDGTTE